jgi:hypothetical protein
VTKLVPTTLLVVLLSACGAGATPTGTPTPTAATPTVALSPTANPPSASPTAPAVATPSPSATARSEPQVGTIVPQAIFSADLSVGTFVFADNAVWAFDASGVTKIDTGTNTSAHLDLLAEDGSKRFSVFGAIGFGSIWVTDFENDEVRRYDEGDGSLQSVIETSDPEGIIVAGDSVWVAEHRTGTVARIDPETDQIAATVEVGTSGTSGPERLIAVNDQIWTGIPRDLAVAGIDAATNAAIGAIEVAAPGNPCGDIGSFGDRLYISGCSSSQSLSVVDIATMEAVASPEFEGSVSGPVTIGEQLWLGVIGSQGSLTSLNPTSLEVVRSVPVTGGAPLVLLVADGSLWVSIEREPQDWILRLPISAFE